jgi:hypothetical protein
MNEVKVKLNPLNTVFVSGEVLSVVEPKNVNDKIRYTIKVTPFGNNNFTLQCKLKYGEKIPKVGDKILNCANLRFNEQKKKYTLNVGYWYRFNENINVAIIEALLVSTDNISNNELEFYTHNVERKAKAETFICPITVVKNDNAVIGDMLKIYNRYFIEGAIINEKGFIKLKLLHLKSAEPILQTITIGD